MFRQQLSLRASRDLIFVSQLHSLFSLQAWVWDSHFTMVDSSNLEMPMMIALIHWSSKSPMGHGFHSGLSHQVSMTSTTRLTSTYLSKTGYTTSSQHLTWCLSHPRIQMPMTNQVRFMKMEIWTLHSWSKSSKIKMALSTMTPARVSHLHLARTKSWPLPILKSSFSIPLISMLLETQTQALWLWTLTIKTVEAAKVRRTNGWDSIAAPSKEPRWLSPKKVREETCRCAAMWPRASHPSTSSTSRIGQRQMKSSEFHNFFHKIILFS